MNDRHQLDNCLELMYALMQYRNEPVNRRLRKMGKRESMLHTDALQLIYHLARICHGRILEIGAVRGGSTVAASWGVSSLSVVPLRRKKWRIYSPVARAL